MQQEGTNNLLLWVVGIGALIVGAFYLLTNKGGSSTVIVGSNGQAANAIAASNEAYNQAALNTQLGLAQTAAQLESTRLGYKASITTNAQNNQAAYELAQVETAYELANNKQTLAAQTSQLQITTAGATTITQIEAQNALAETKLNDNLAHAISDNQTTQERIAHGSSFGNFLNGIVGNFSGIAQGLAGLGLKI